MTFQSSDSENLGEAFQVLRLSRQGWHKSAFTTDPGVRMRVDWLCETMAPVFKVDLDILRAVFVETCLHIRVHEAERDFEDAAVHADGAIFLHTSHADPVEVREKILCAGLTHAIPGRRRVPGVTCSDEWTLTL